MASALLYDIVPSSRVQRIPADDTSLDAALHVKEIVSPLVTPICFIVPIGKLISSTVNGSSAAEMSMLRPG